MKKHLCLLLMLAFIINMLVGCSYLFKPEDLIDDESQQQQKEKDEEKQVDPYPVYGGEMRISMVDSAWLNPLLLTSKSSYNVFNLIYDNLVEYDSEFKVEPGLASSWEFEGDGEQVTFFIRQGVKWHDGEELTADDVKFTLDMIFNNKIESPYKSQLSTFIKSYNVQDKNSIRVVFNKPVGGMLGILSIPIIPQHYYQSAEFMLKNQHILPVGTGAYQVTEYNNRKDMLLKSNKDWWKAKPYIDKINVKLVPDEQAQIAALETGLIDVCSAKAIDAEKYNQFENMNTCDFVTQEYEFIALNQKDIIFQDKFVRKAIAMGINKAKIIEKVLLNHAIDVDVPVQPQSWLYDQSLDIYEFDPKQAEEQLSMGGWTDKDNDGILSKEIDGKEIKLEFELLTNEENEIRKIVAQEIVKDLEKLGMDIDLKYAEWQQVQDDPDAGTKLQGIIKKGDFDAVLIGYNLSRVPDLSFAFHSRAIKDGTNFVYYSNEKLDQQLDSVGQYTQEKAFRSNFIDIAKTIGEDLPYISLYFRTSSLVAAEKIKDVEVYSEDELYGCLHEWYIFEQ
ncbi:MAG: ABC transporter substrate-binding protein [Clostridia bacterium]|nr:ABC transporter substrate-binding protein [Clostridia bacterium]